MIFGTSKSRNLSEIKKFANLKSRIVLVSRLSIYFNEFREFRISRVSKLHKISDSNFANLKIRFRILNSVRKYYFT